MAASSALNNNRSQANGVLQISTSQTTATGNTSKSAGPKLPALKLKLVIRRLPPGLTESEFLTVLGDEWKVGQGKVDWFLYKGGKDSKDPSKPSRPSRAYLHLTKESHLLSLSDTVRQSIFEDAQNTFTNPCLIGPPTVEFAPYGRTPGGRRRVDARAGTIDQDPEFMAFLEGLANPTTSKELNADSLAEGSSTKQEKVTMTPLVQYLKDKKANKNKEAAVKAAKKQESQHAKGKAAKDTHDDTKKKGKDAKADKLVGKATKEAVKILNRTTSAKTASESSQKAAGSGSDASTAPKLDLGKVPGRQRSAVLAAHIRMLQRDLGLSPAQAHRQVRRDTADAQKAERAATAVKASAELTDASSQPAQSPTVPTAPKASSSQSQSRRSRAKGPALPESQASKRSPSTAGSSTAGPSTPMVLLKKPETTQSVPSATPATQPPKVAPTGTPRRPQSTPAPSEGATQAFIKHANPSQGVTEALLKEAMEKFGPVSVVEIDKRKGFAYVDFTEPGALKKAMAANPISVAQGTVQVMQRKGTALPPEKKPVHQAPHAPSRGGRGGRGGMAGRRGGRGGGRGGANAAQAPASAPTGPAAK
ncbi:putative Regulator of nonsense transcripts 3A [Venustampulla echinocandica]|uniref:Putative Regulator of nonsense transcripts 3A n=1 Tax=Venustampulla echinocandica TaxID=2656787 RepID=A0A370TZL1_9HELO|nr:putative Regulator of nonsense transcripts 3A [Venustampulla echinocandica]RDL40967.1 putative Regulator of nonsense transcripts 3A [Venustampulla echinocandica]